MVNYIIITATAHATEDEDKVLDAMAYFLPDVVGEDDVELEVVETDGYFGNPINVYKMTINKKANKVFKHIMDLLKSDERNINKLKKDIDLRIEKNKLYLRFDKQKAYLGECKLMDGDDVVRIVINFKVYVSKNKEEKVKERVLKELGIE
ncbi:RNA-binding domain-containing protein [Methanotorris igneus]|uniref:Exosome subunit n=1 Tax=Methanotorris igneus (strain DSM 5666 / JCM 11834 / Kol 5) TaxID=880724 RepID=F6BCD2_METIK|nr:RNA-binding domain-containing protein [Methanotorris igneus]AEF96143.1 protein of unknown function DUF54 [Methanotorris igneus Kol 5]